MSDREQQVFSVGEEEAEQEAKMTPKKTEPTEPVVEPLDEIRQRALSAYAAYMDAERQVEKAYKEQEQQ